MSETQTLGRKEAVDLIDAHSNPHVDNCSICAPRWGVVGDRVKIR